MDGRRRESQRGVALILTIFMTVIATLLVAALAMSWQPDREFFTKTRVKDMAYQGADAGMRQAEAFLFSLYYARLGSPEAPQEIPMNPNADLTWAPRTLGDNAEDPSHNPVNGIDNFYNGVFSQLDAYFYGPNQTAVGKSTGQNLQGVVWPSQFLPDNRRVRYKVMMTETATVTTNNPDDRAIDTYSRQVTIYSVGVITKYDAWNVPKLIPAQSGSMKPNCSPKIILKKRIVFQVKRRRGWAAAYLDPSIYPSPPPPGDPAEKWLPLPTKTLRVTDASAFKASDKFLFSQRAGSFLGNEIHFAGDVKAPPIATVNEITIAGSPLDLGKLNYEYQTVIASRPLILSVGRSTLPLLNARQFVTSVIYYLLGKVIATNAAAPYRPADLDTLVDPNNTDNSFLTRTTGGVNDLTRWNSFIWYISTGTSGAAPPAGLSVSDMECKGWLPAASALPNTCPAFATTDNTVSKNSRDLYDALRNAFIANVKAGTFRDVPQADLLVDSTYTDYLVQMPYRSNWLATPKPAGLSLPYPTSPYPLATPVPTTDSVPPGSPVKMDPPGVNRINYAVVPDPDGDYTDWIWEVTPS